MLPHTSFPAKTLPTSTTCLSSKPDRVFSALPVGSFTVIAQYHGDQDALVVVDKVGGFGGGIGRPLHRTVLGKIEH